MQAAIIGTLNSNPPVDARDMLRSAGIDALQRQVGYVPQQLPDVPTQPTLPTLPEQYMPYSIILMREFVDDPAQIADTNPSLPFLVLAWVCMMQDEKLYMGACRHQIVAVYLRIVLGFEIEAESLTKFFDDTHEKWVDWHLAINEEKVYISDDAYNVWLTDLIISIYNNRLTVFTRDMDFMEDSDGAIVVELLSRMKAWSSYSDAQCFKVICDIFLRIYTYQLEQNNPEDK